MIKSSRLTWITTGMAGAFAGAVLAGSSLVSAQIVQPVPGAGAQNNQQQQHKYPAGTRDINATELQTIVTNLNQSIDTLSGEQAATSGARNRALTNLKKARDAVQRELNELEKQAADKGIEQLHQRDSQAKKMAANQYYPGLQQTMQSIQSAQQTLEAQREDKNNRRQHALTFLQESATDVQKEMGDYAKAHPEVLTAAAPNVATPAAATPNAAAPAAAPMAGLNAQQAAALVPGTGKPMKASDGPLPQQLQRILDHIDNSLDTLSRQPDDKAGHHQQTVKVLQDARQQILEEMQELGLKPQG